MAKHGNKSRKNKKQDEAVVDEAKKGKGAVKEEIEAKTEPATMNKKQKNQSKEKKKEKKEQPSLTEQVKLVAEAQERLKQYADVTLPEPEARDTLLVEGATDWNQAISDAKHNKATAALSQTSKGTVTMPPHIVQAFRTYGMVLLRNEASTYESRKQPATICLCECVTVSPRAAAKKE